MRLNRNRKRARGRDLSIRDLLRDKTELIHESFVIAKEFVYEFTVSVANRCDVNHFPGGLGLRLLPWLRTGTFEQPSRTSRLRRGNPAPVRIRNRASMSSLF